MLIPGIPLPEKSQKECSLIWVFLTVSLNENVEQGLNIIFLESS